MQIVCESCGHAGPAGAVRIDGDDIVVSCAECGADAVLGTSPTRTPAAGPPPDGEPDAPRVVDAPDPEADPGPPLRAADAPTATAHRQRATERALPPVKCPKCGHRQHDDHACHKCGLVFALAASGRRPWETPPQGKELAVQRADELWASVEARPEDGEVHAAFYEHCRSSGIASWAAMRYRHWLADHPDDPLAETFLERAIADAQAFAQAMTRGEAERFARAANRARAALLALVAVMLVIATVVIVRLIQHNQQMAF